MKEKCKGVGFFVMGLVFFYYSLYWFAYHTQRTFGELVRQYSFFTNQTILLLSIYLVGIALYYLGWQEGEKILFNSKMKTGITSYVFMVSLGYYLGVTRFYTIGYDSLYIGEVQSIFMHFVAPLFVGLIYHRTPFIGRIEKKEIVAMGMYPLCYLYYATWYSRYSGEYIYPVFDPLVLTNSWQMPFYIVLGFLSFWWVVGCVGKEHNRYHR